MSKKTDQIRANRGITNPSPLPSVNSGSSNQIYDRFNPEAGGIIEQTGGDYLGNYGTPFIGYDGPVGSNGKPTISQKDYGTFLSNGKSSSITSKVVAGPVSPFATTTNAAMYSPTVYKPRPLMKTAGATTTDPKNPFKKKEEEQQQITLKPVVKEPVVKESELTNKFGIDTKGWTGEDYNKRNDRIAYDLIGGGVQNEQGVRNNLMQYDSFKGASAQDQNNTIQQILGRIGSQNARTGEVDQIAKQIGYKDFRDFSAKAGSAVAGQVNSLINDIQSYKAQGDVAGENYARAALADVMAQGKNLDVEESIRNTDTLVALSKMNPQTAGVVEQYNLVQNLMGQGIDYNDLPKYIGKDQQYINALLGGQREKLGVELSPEMKGEVFAKMKLDKSYMDAENAKKQEAIALQMERNTQDFLKAADRQRADNQVQKDNMSKLARMTGVGYSSAGVEGMDRVFEQGRQAMQDLQDLHSRSSYDLQKQLADVSDAYIYNTKVYDLSYKDSMKNITNSFMQDVQQIQGRFGKNSAAALDNITKTTTTYMTNLSELSKFREKQQADLNNDLWGRYKDGINMNMDQQKLNLQYKEFGLRQDEFNLKAKGTAAAQPFNRNQQITTIKNIASQSGNMQQFAQGVAQLPDGMKGGQCGAFANDIAVGMGLPKLFADSLKDKLKARNSTTPTIGSFVIMDTGVKLKNGEKAGHVSYIVGINKDGTAIVKDSNRAGDERIGTHTINLNNKQIVGYVDPNKKTTSIPKGAKEDSLPSNNVEPLSSDQRTTFNSQLSSFRGNDVVKKFEQSIYEYENIKSSISNPSGPGDIAAIFTFMKTLDPSSVVREGEFEIAAKSAGVVSGVKNLFNKVSEGKRLTETQRQDFSKLAQSFVQNKAKSYDRLYDDMVRVTNNMGIDNSYLPERASDVVWGKNTGGSGTNSGTPPTIVNKYKSR